jgi:anaerobic C4-dicarboxylate transporter
MRWLTLYVRSRRVPIALAVAGGVAVAMWSLWTAFSDARDVDVWLVILTVLLLAAALTTTIEGPDDALERTAALSCRRGVPRICWRRRRSC